MKRMIAALLLLLVSIATLTNPANAIAASAQAGRTIKLICTLLFLPPYSPKLNKIEKFWARLKHYLRKTLSQSENFWDAMNDAFNSVS